MTSLPEQFLYPRRRFFRGVLRGLIRVVLPLLTDFHVEGIENLPDDGPLILVGNHFSYIDPIIMVCTTEWPLEFIAGTINPGTPWTATWLPALWGVFRARRGTGSTHALKASSAILDQGGVLGIFPEGGAWADVLRPARPGAAYLAVRTGAKLVPYGINGLTEVFPALHRLKRARVEVRIGEPFGPYEIAGRRRERRQQLDDIGDDIMRHIAAMLPSDSHGVFSDDPALRKAAQEAAIYPWVDKVEGEIPVGEHLRAMKRRRHKE